MIMLRTPKFMVVVNLGGELGEWKGEGHGIPGWTEVAYPGSFGRGLFMVFAVAIFLDVEAAGHCVSVSEKMIGIANVGQ
jgi:hypothetical protein